MEGFLIPGPARGSLGSSLGYYGPFAMVTPTQETSTHKQRSLERKEGSDPPFPRELSYQALGIYASPSIG